MRHLPTLAILAFLPVLASATASDGRPVRNSFIDRPVANTEDLLRHVRSDRVVADRYERHFSMDRASVLRFLGTLHRARLARTGTFTIYSVPTDGHIKMHVGRIPKGEPMFMDRRNRPVLVVRCGNPVVLGPQAHRANAPLRIGEASGLRKLSFADALASEDQPLALMPSIPESSLPTAVAFAIDGEPVPDVNATGRAILPLASHFPSLGGLALILPILGAQGGHGAHQGSGTITPPRNPPPVPEPAPLLALAAGAAALARKRRK